MISTNRQQKTSEEIRTLVQFFELLIEWDQEEHPEKFKSTNGDTERADALLTYQAKEENQTGT